jgi:uncharacterized protein (TIGR02271 family)
MSNNESVQEKARLNTLVEQLKSKLKNFVVIDRQGELLGEVKDLILDNNRQLNLVVSQMGTAQSLRRFLLSSKLIQKTNAPNKSLLVDINKAELEQLPEYVPTQTLSRKFSETSTNLVTSAPEAADEGIDKNSAHANSADMPTPVESKDIQEEPDKDSVLLSSNSPEVLEEELIRLLGERVVVDRSKRKVGEVIVRKEIETRMVQIQVPVRHEKLIVEQVSPERKKLAEIDLGQEEVTGIEVPVNESQELELDRLDKLSNLTDSNA